MMPRQPDRGLIGGDHGIIDKAVMAEINSGGDMGGTGMQPPITNITMCGDMQIMRPAALCQRISTLGLGAQ